MLTGGDGGWGIIQERSGVEGGGGGGGGRRWGMSVEYWLPGNDLSDILIKEKTLGGPSISPEWQGVCVLVHISQNIHVFLCVCLCTCVCVCVCVCLWCNIAAATQERGCIEPRPWTCTYMSVQGPVVYFELVDEDLHGASDLVDLQQQLSLLLLIGPCNMQTAWQWFRSISHMTRDQWASQAPENLRWWYFLKKNIVEYSPHWFTVCSIVWAHYNLLYPPMYNKIWILLWINFP